MRRAVTLALALLLAGAAGAQPEPSPLERDERLGKRVTVHWRKTSLAAALKELSRAAGVECYPERALTDEPIMASFTDVPAREVMAQVARLLHFTWVPYGGTRAAPTYLLYQSQKAKQEEAAELAGARLAVERELQAGLERLRRLSRLPPEQRERELNRLQQGIEQAYVGSMAGPQSPGAARGLLDGISAQSVGTPIGRAMLEMLEGFSPGVWDRIRQEEPVVFSSTPGLGELLLPEGLENRLREGRPGFPLPRGLVTRLGTAAEDGIRRAEEAMQGRWSMAEGFRVTVQMNLTLGEQPVGMLRVSPAPSGDDPMNALFAMSGLMIMGAPRSTEEPEEDPAAREARFGKDPVLGRKAVLKLPPPAERPALPAPVVVPGQGAYRVAEVLEAVEKTFGVHLVADAYSRQGLPTFPKPDDKPVALYQVLDRLAGAARRWEREGSTIRLRSRSWAHDRRGEIPLSWMGRWLTLRKKQGSLNLDQLAEIALALRDEQVEGLMVAAMELEDPRPLDFVAVSQARGVLRFYGRLLPAQRARLLAGGALPVS
ncbi:MAG: hypothetical protein FJX77_09110, partial [Armatimonadetes bacterium]|nr:hypothetical protein [Armatimonadota bacterium]